MAKITQVVGRNLRALRKKKGLTQEELAERLGVSAVFVGLLERGKNNPSFELLEKIAAEFAVPCAALFFAPENPDPTPRPTSFLEDDILRRVTLAIRAAFENG